MKIVAVQDIKDASHLLIFIDKIENKDLKLIKNTKQKTLS